MRNKINLFRRATIMGAVCAVGLTLVPTHSVALNDQTAADLVGRLVADINTVINSGKAEPEMFKDFETVLVRYGDISIIARSALGVTWRSASASQRTQFTTAFQGYIARKYGRRFREFVGGNIEVKSAKKVKSGYLVTSTADLKGSSPFIVEWQVSDKSGQDKFFNLYIEGINMLATERTEIGAMLDKRGGNLNRLIADLKTTG